jgi:hypothetical protein
MNLQFTEEERAFRDEVRDWISANLPEDIAHKTAEGLQLTKDDIVRWQKILGEKGWLAPAWPEKYGGTGWTPTQRHIFNEEMAAAGAPEVIPFGAKMVGPVIYTFGSEAQKERHLPGILSSDVWWCQGYSEPGSGSDLASLRTRAVREGDHYVVNGQKTWTTLAQYADWIFCLVRTDPDAKAQEGISFLLIDMTSPGITVDPIVTIDGGREINSVFFEDVKVPVENLVGEENKGWTYAKFLLANERSGIARVAQSKKAIAKLKHIASVEQDGAAPLIESGDFRRRVAELEIKLKALEHTELRYVAKESGGGAPGAEVSMLKIRGTEVQQGITELVCEAVGHYALPFQPDQLTEGWNEEPITPNYAMAALPRYGNMRKTSIYGGSNEIQKNILSKMVLGL